MKNFEHGSTSAQLITERPEDNPRVTINVTMRLRDWEKLVYDINKAHTETVTEVWQVLDEAVTASGGDWRGL